MGARDEPVVDGELIRQVSAFGDLDGVDLADEVGDRDVGCGELLAVAPIGRQPDELDGIAVVRDAILARRADRLEGIIVDLTSGVTRVESSGKSAPVVGSFSPSAPAPGAAPAGQFEDRQTIEFMVVALQHVQLPIIERLRPKAEPRYARSSKDAAQQITAKVARIGFHAELAALSKREPMTDDAKQSLKLPRRQVRRRPAAEKERIDFMGLAELR